MPAARAQPDSEDEVSELVRAAAKGARIKVVGAGHSWSDIACTDGMLLSLDRLDRVLEVHEDRREVTVEAGIRLRALNAAMRGGRHARRRVLRGVSSASRKGGARAPRKDPWR
jgi:FAD/FMN-containing dehydrogenase